MYVVGLLEYGYCFNFENKLVGDCMQDQLMDVILCVLALYKVGGNYLSMDHYIFFYPDLIYIFIVANNSCIIEWMVGEVVEG
jgi:hypothetical protein